MLSKLLYIFDVVYKGFLEVFDWLTTDQNLLGITFNPLALIFGAGLFIYLAGLIIDYFWIAD